MKTLLIFVLANCAILSYGRVINYNNNMNDELTNNYWVFHSFIDTVNNDTSIYPAHGKKIWLEFKEDSVFLNGYCPTVGTWYNLINDTGIEVGELLVILECGEPSFELSGWNYRVTCLSGAYHFEVNDGHLIIKTEKINKMIFLQSDDISDVANFNADKHPKPLLLDNYSNTINQQIINYYLPLSIEDAHIVIYDLNGKKLYNLAIQEKGKSSITVPNSLLKRGLYFCSLFVDGRKVDTKKMIVPND